MASAPSSSIKGSPAVVHATGGVLIGVGALVDLAFLPTLFASDSDTMLASARAGSH